MPINLYAWYPHVHTHKINWYLEYFKLMGTNVEVRVFIHTIYNDN